MFTSPVILIIAFLFSLSIHEAAHAYAADRLGDPTARLSGRVTLNPLAHLDPVGTLLPLFLLFTGSPIIFGWGKPVPFDPFNLKNPRRDAALISFAGPASNLVLATFLAILIRLGPFFLGTNVFLMELFLVPVIALNIMWALFNLIPIHPLDGGKVLIGLLPQDLAIKWDEVLNQYGLILLLLLIFPFFGASGIILILSPLINLILNFLLPGTALF
ncbi:MAG TPA: site-2 protease family protein [Candidatus Bathyarchaeia archaeon]|nr:site-2 protease family protein [Candidatus Bathyarchaeia archaeon]